MAKKNESVIGIEDLMEKNDALQAENAALVLENGDLQKQVKLLVEQNIKADDKYNEERAKRRDVQSVIADQTARIDYLTVRLREAERVKGTEKEKRHVSIPKFVIVASIALVVLMASFMLQKLSILGPSLGYGIQCSMAMVIAWCYAIIWDRSRNN